MRRLMLLVAVGGALAVGVAAGRTAAAGGAECVRCVAGGAEAWVSPVGGEGSPRIVTGGGGDTARVTVPEGRVRVADVDSVDPEGDTEGDGLWYAAGETGDSALFAVDRSTGEVAFRRPPDAEHPVGTAGDGVYLLEVTVSDSEGLSDAQLIFVEVGDVAEPPEIITAGGRDYARLSVPEGSRRVATISATDPEAGHAAGGLTFFTVADRCRDGDWLEWCDDTRLFEIDPASGGLSFISPPHYDSPGDRNAQNVYEVVVGVRDRSGLEDRQILEIEVVDAAVPPAFVAAGDRPWTAVAVPEGETIVTDLDAEDWEGEAEGTGLRYSLAPGWDEGAFLVDETTGLVTFRALPDFEKPIDANGDNVYLVMAMVADSSGAEDRLILVVLVEDVEQKPDITSDGGAAFAVVAVTEGQSFVTTVFAADEDPAELVYRIDGGPDAELFGIHSSTGELRFLEAPDFDRPADSDGDNRYVVSITATDGDGLADRQEVWVEVAARSR